MLLSRHARVEATGEAHSGEKRPIRERDGREWDHNCCGDSLVSQPCKCATGSRNLVAPSPTFAATGLRGVVQSSEAVLDEQLARGSRGQLPQNALAVTRHNDASVGAVMFSAFSWSTPCSSWGVISLTWEHAAVQYALDFALCWVYNASSTVVDVRPFSRLNLRIMFQC